MVSAVVDIEKQSYKLSYQNCEESLQIETYDFFKNLELFETDASLITPDWFNSFHSTFFSNIKSKLSIMERIKLRVFGINVKVNIQDEKLLDDLILGTLFGIFEHLLMVRIVVFQFKEERLKAIKYTKSLEFLVSEYHKTKNEDYRIRSKIYDMDKFFDNQLDT